jgi:Yip1 domain
MPQSQGAAVQPAAQRMSALGRLGNVIIEPTRTFADIAARPGWWVPMILISALSLSFMVAFSQRVGWERFMRQTIESSTNQQIQNMSAEERERVIQLQSKFAGPSATVMAVAATPAMMLAISAVLLFVFGTMLGGTVNFKQTLGVVSHAWIPTIFSTAAALLVLFIKAPEDFDLKNPAGFNVGFYLDPQSTPAWLVSLGNSIDVFSIWVILLLATGMSVAAKKSWAASFMGVALLWALFVAVKVAWTAIFG